MVVDSVVRLIETHADQLTSSLVDKLVEHEKLVEIRRVPREKLLMRAYEMYSDLSDWLINRLATDVENIYLLIGMLRARQGFALSTIAGAYMVTKQHLFDFIKEPVPGVQPLEPIHRLEVMELSGQFFDRALFHAARGYERSRLNDITAERLQVLSTSGH